MANPEHLHILKQGAEAWNQWRRHNPDIKPDLYMADFRMIGTMADLRMVDFSRASLVAANGCIGGDFTGADFTEAALSNADFALNDLTGANFTRAYLWKTDFTQSNLTMANLSEARLLNTIFGETNLTDVEGLETCDHRGPSTLDHRTLAKSGPLPLAFLRGCGLNDWEIEVTKLYDQSLTSSQVTDILDRIHTLRTDPWIQFYSCFISYASKDHAFAERLYADLQNKGVRCWFAPEDMKIGDHLRPRVDETIRLYDKLLLVLSKTSVASQWVEQEVETALARERQQGTTILFPIRIDNTVMTLETGWPALIRNTRLIGDFQGWETHAVYQQAFDRLLRDLKAAERQTKGSRPGG